MGGFNRIVSTICSDYICGGFGSCELIRNISAGYLASVFFVFVIVTFGYTSFRPFDVEAFFSCYTMAILSIIFYAFWKIFKRTSFKNPSTVDLVWETPQVDAYEARSTDVPQTFWGEMFQMITLKRLQGKRDD